MTDEQREYGRQWRERNPQLVVEARRRYYENNKAAILARHKAYRLAHADQERERKKRWNKNNPEKAKAHIRKSVYGIDQSYYESMLKKQRNRCAVCRVVFDARKRKTTPCVDHCHKSKRVRGLLCQGCNILVGHIEHPHYEKAINYLKDVR